MIHAKPLKIKGLRRQSPSEATIEGAPSQRHDSNITPPLQQHIKEVDLITHKIEMKGKLLKKVIHYIVDNTGGIKAWYVNDLVREFCKMHGIKYTVDIGSVSAYLKHLTDEGKIKRIQYEDVYYYFPMRY